MPCCIDPVLESRHAEPAEALGPDIVFACLDRHDEPAVVKLLRGLVLQPHYAARDGPASKPWVGRHSLQQSSKVCLPPRPSRPSGRRSWTRCDRLVFSWRCPAGGFEIVKQGPTRDRAIRLGTDVRSPLLPPENLHAVLELQCTAAVLTASAGTPAHLLSTQVYVALRSRERARARCEHLLAPKLPAGWSCSRFLAFLASKPRSQGSVEAVTCHPPRGDTHAADSTGIIRYGLVTPC